MKQLLKLLFVFLMVGFFIGCSSNDDEDMEMMEEPNPIEGAWKAMSFDSDLDLLYTPDTSINILEIIQLEGENLDYSITFNETGWIAQGSYDVRQSTTVVGVESSAISASYSDTTATGEYTLTGDVLSSDDPLFALQLLGLDLSSFPQSVTTKSFSITDDVLTVVQEEEYVTLESDTLTITQLLTTTSVWEKQ